MSITIDQSAINEAKARVHTWNGRHAVAHKGDADPAVVERCRGELATAVIRRTMVTQFAKRPNLTVPQRFELIDLLMPSDSQAVDEILGLLHESRAGAATSHKGDAHGST
jgi:hypothetical protein